MTYRKSSDGLQLESANFGRGVIRVTGTTGNQQEVNYFLTDHLSSVRVIVDGNGVVKERNDYYPFGARHARSDYALRDGNRLKYNGKEEQVTGDLDFLDYGARMYDSGLGRWFGMDALAEDYLSKSPYHFSGNNPSILIEKDGQYYDWFVDADGSLYYNPLWKKGDELKLGETWSWLGPNGMFGMDDEFIIRKFSSLVSFRGVVMKLYYDQRTGNWYYLPFSTAYFDMSNARDFMDEMGYEYAMTQYVEDNAYYTMNADKGRGRMADFIYGKQEITVEKATYLPKDVAILNYLSMEYLRETTLNYYGLNLFRENTIRYTKPYVIDASWNTFW